MVDNQSQGRSADEPSLKAKNFILSRHFESLRLLEDDCRSIGFYKAALLADLLISEFERLARDSNLNNRPANDEIAKKARFK